MIRKLLKKITYPFLKLGTKTYFSKPRLYEYEGVEVMVMPDVFPPHYTISTKIILDFIKPLNIEHKTVLELGCGSGIIALYASSKKAEVTASDINKTALKMLSNTSLKNAYELNIIESNLFDSIKNQGFDYVIINPPYYAKTPKNIKEQAWFCGENFEYYTALFSQLVSRNDKTVLMILSEDCDLKTIQSLAAQNNLKFILQLEKKVLGEKNYIFKIEAY